MAITLNGTGSGFNRSVINDNFQKIEDELNNNVLRRGNVAGNEDNAMREDLDMNSNRILNLPAPGSQFEPVRLIDLTGEGVISFTPNAAEVVFDGSVDYSANNVEDALEREASLRQALENRVSFNEGNLVANNLTLNNLGVSVDLLESEMDVVQNRSLGNLVDISSLSSSKANRAVSPVSGHIATLDSQGDLVDSGKALSDLATATQGSRADTALQPADNISELTNDSGFITGISAFSIGDLSNVDVTGNSAGRILEFDASGNLVVGDKASGGTTSFAGLTDTPSSYAGQAGKIVTVNAGENGLEYTSITGAGLVDSVFGRVGEVVAQSGDYNSDQITNNSAVTGSSVSDALEAVAASVPNVTGKMDKVGTPVLDNFISQDASGNAKDSGFSASSFATSAQGSRADTAIQSEDLTASNVTCSNSQGYTSTDVQGVINELGNKGMAVRKPNAVSSAIETALRDKSAFHWWGSGTGDVFSGKAASFGGLINVPVAGTSSALIGVDLTGDLYTQYNTGTAKKYYHDLNINTVTDPINQRIDDLDLASYNEYGLGVGDLPDIPSNNIDDTSILSGKYVGYTGAHSNATGGDNPFPTDNTAFVVTISRSDFGAATPYVTQEAIKYASTTAVIKVRTGIGETWTSWKTITNEYKTPYDYGASLSIGSHPSILRDMFAEGGNIYLPSGFWYFDDITITSETNLSGMGVLFKRSSEGQMTINGAFFADALRIHSAGTTDSTFNYLEINSPATIGWLQMYGYSQRSQTGGCVVTSGNIIIDRLTSINVARPLEFRPASGTAFRSNIVIGNYDIRNYIRGIRFERCNNVLLGEGTMSVRWSGLTPNQPGQNGILIETCDNIQVGDTYIANSGEHAVRIGGAGNVSNIRFGTITVKDSAGCALKSNVDTGWLATDCHVDSVHGYNVGEGNNEGNREVVRLSKVADWTIGKISAFGGCTRALVLADVDGLEVNSVYGDGVRARLIETREDYDNTNSNVTGVHIHHATAYMSGARGAVGLGYSANGRSIGTFRIDKLFVSGVTHFGVIMTGSNLVGEARINIDFDGTLTRAGIVENPPPSKVYITSTYQNIINYFTTPVYADDSAAGSGGLVSGDVYKTATGELRVKV